MKNVWVRSHVCHSWTFRGRAFFCRKVSIQFVFIFPLLLRSPQQAHSKLTSRTVSIPVCTIDKGDWMRVHHSTQDLTSCLHKGRYRLLYPGLPWLNQPRLQNRGQAQTTLRYEVPLQCCYFNEGQVGKSSEKKTDSGSWKETKEYEKTKKITQGIQPNWLALFPKSDRLICSQNAHPTWTPIPNTTSNMLAHHVLGAVLCTSFSLETAVKRMRNFCACAGMNYNT